MNKFGSNVIDKIVSNCTKSQIGSLLNHLGEDDSVQTSPLRELVVSQFANFPLQKLLNEAVNYNDETIKHALIALLDKL